MKLFTHAQGSYTPDFFLYVTGKHIDTSTVVRIGDRLSDRYVDYQFDVKAPMTDLTIDASRYYEIDP